MAEEVEGILESVQFKDVNSEHVEWLCEMFNTYPPGSIATLILMVLLSHRDVKMVTPEIDEEKEQMIMYLRTYLQVIGYPVPKVVEKEDD